MISWFTFRKLLFKLIFLILAVVSFNCRVMDSNDKTLGIDDIKVFVSQNYEGFEIVDNNFELFQGRSPFPSFTANFFKGDSTGNPHILSFDIYGDRNNEYLVRIYKTEFIESTHPTRDSIFTSKTLLITQTANRFHALSDSIYYSWSFFGGTIDKKINHEIGFINSGLYRRGYPFYDSVLVETTSIGIYDTYSSGIIKINQDGSIEEIPMNWID